MFIKKIYSLNITLFSILLLVNYSYSHNYLSRLTKLVAVLQNQHQDDEDVWQVNLLDRYLARPNTNTFNAMFFAEFASSYKVVYGQHAEASSEQQDDQGNDNESQETTLYRLQNNLGYIRKRLLPAVVRYPHFNKEHNSERYYCNLLRVYIGLIVHSN